MKQKDLKRSGQSSTIHCHMICTPAMEVAKERRELSDQQKVSWWSKNTETLHVPIIINQHACSLR